MTSDGRNPVHLILPAMLLVILDWTSGSPPGWTTINSVHAARPAGVLASFDQASGIIETSRNICLLLTLYLSDTPAQHSRGLMFVEQMEEYEGMLFRHSQPVDINMWMKNTYIPLDMLFIRQDGSIAGIEKNTTPLSTRRISSPERVSGVLELNAGFADRWAIEPDNRLLTVN